MISFIVMSGMTVASADLDLQEANVTNVNFEKLSEAVYRFDVTLIHDDDNEDGFADSWQVETIEGALLGIRILVHAHSSEEFTRSADINIPDNIKIVIVRGHDQTHGFGGQIIAVEIYTKNLQFIDQGPDETDISNFEFDFDALDSETINSTLGNQTITGKTESSEEGQINFPSVFFTSLFVLFVVKRVSTKCH